MNQDLLEWLLLVARWVHITTAVTWIGTSIFFMWLDRTFTPNPEATRPGHIGDLWMVHGGGFYHVEKLQMGPTKVPDHLHWFKWESYWTWLSGMSLVALIFYTGDGTFLLDSAVSSMTYQQGVALSLFAIFGSWIVYDLLWESPLTKKSPAVGHLLTIAWVAAAAYILCHTMSGRAAYLHVGAMMGTWMTANVFMRIIPRQVEMVKAAKAGESVDPTWAKNAKNRSTHNTYLTLPVIFVMLSNHFPSTYGHPLNWLILLGLSIGAAAIREYFVSRVRRPGHAALFGVAGVAIIAGIIAATSLPSAKSENVDTTDTSSLAIGTCSAESAAKDECGVAGNHDHATHAEDHAVNAEIAKAAASTGTITPIPKELDLTLRGDENPKAAPVGPTQTVRGTVLVTGNLPAPKQLQLPLTCQQGSTGPTTANDVLIKDGRVQNVLVRVIKGHESLPTGAVPSTPVELDQRGCVYHPRLVVARVGQDVVFINSDPIFHNVKSFSTKNAVFNFAMPNKGQRVTKRFTAPEISLQTKCSVHPWMGAYIAVVDHPYVAVTNERGEFEIPGLPAGHYTLEFWHEVFGTQTQTIDVGASGAAPVTVTFKK